MAKREYNAAEIRRHECQINTRDILHTYADKYETVDFLEKEPLRFMHQVSGVANQEIMAFIAACLSYGSGEQFVPKIQCLYDNSRGTYMNG